MDVAAYIICFVYPFHGGIFPFYLKRKPVHDKKPGVPILGFGQIFLGNDKTVRGYRLYDLVHVFLGVFVHKEDIFPTRPLQGFKDDFLILLLEEFGDLLWLPGDNGLWPEDLRKMLKVHFVYRIGKTGGVVQYDHAVTHGNLPKNIWGILCPVASINILRRIVA